MPIRVKPLRYFEFYRGFKITKYTYYSISMLSCLKM